MHFFEKDEVKLECITIEVESFDSPTHVVVPQDDDVGLRDVNEGVDGNREDSPLSEDEHIPEESQPHHSTRVRQAPVPDDNPRYEKSSYNRPSQTPDSVGISWAMTANGNIPHTYADAMN